MAWSVWLQFHLLLLFANFGFFWPVVRVGRSVGRLRSVAFLLVFQPLFLIGTMKVILIKTMLKTKQRQKKL